MRRTINEADLPILLRLRISDMYDSVADAAAGLGWSKSHLNNMLNGNRPLSAEALEYIHVERKVIYLPTRDTDGNRSSKRGGRSSPPRTREGRRHRSVRVDEQQAGQGDPTRREAEGAGRPHRAAHAHRRAGQ